MRHQRVPLVIASSCYGVRAGRSHSVFPHDRGHDRSDFVVVAVNFTPVPRLRYVIGVPEPGWYVELLNSDSEIYGGSNLGNGGGVSSEPVPAHGRPHRLSLQLPPLSCLMLKRKNE